MKEKQALIYWLDTTGPWEYDEIVRLTIIDINNDMVDYRMKLATQLVVNKKRHSA
ncbi:hypothetical protein [Limosilactobacillus vaginalis]|uniref:hypothetical protein n=1 Tax=Limosilactobacillus vaginalis TaxID=1633 RepID=UPI0024B913CE|nr:hypothetical protein [Limosilactobacillus vaginalis]